MIILKNKLLYNQPYCIILIGTPLAGKSTFIKKLRESSVPDFSIISFDETLMEMYRRDYNPTPEEDTYNKAYRLIEQKEIKKEVRIKIEAIQATKGNVVFDMTHMGSKRRRANLLNFPDHYKVAVVFPFISDVEFIKRNAKRTAEENKYISPEVFKTMKESFQPIKDDEGFDYIYNYTPKK